jgi:uncharacterized protein (TIGR03437 family)
VASAGSYESGPVSPGEIVVIYGTNFGDEAKTRVSFDGIPAAAVLYATPTVLAATVPYDVAAPGRTSLMVETEGRRSAPVTLEVVAARPALLTSDASGQGQAAALNQDYSVNGPANPARRGSVLILYGTGGGTLTQDVPARLALPVSVTIGGGGRSAVRGKAAGVVSGDGATERRRAAERTSGQRAGRGPGRRRREPRGRDCGGKCGVSLAWVQQSATATS